MFSSFLSFLLLLFTLTLLLRENFACLQQTWVLIELHNLASSRWRRLCQLWAFRRERKRTALLGRYRKSPRPTRRWELLFKLDKGNHQLVCCISEKVLIIPRWWQQQALLVRLLHCTPEESLNDAGETSDAHALHGDRGEMWIALVRLKSSGSILRGLQGLVYEVHLCTLWPYKKEWRCLHLADATWIRFPVGEVPFQCSLFLQDKLTSSVIPQAHCTVWVKKKVFDEPEMSRFYTHGWVCLYDVSTFGSHTRRCSCRDHAFIETK